MNSNTVIGIFFVFIIPIVCLILFIRVLYLQNILSKKKKAKIYYENKRKETEAAQNAIKREILHSPASFYSLNDSCMNKSESLMFYYLNMALHNLIRDSSERKNYYIFPQVSLHSLIHMSGVPSFKENIAKTNYIAKSIDFVICYCHKVGTSYHYTPVLLIELDGQSHFSSSAYGSASFNRQVENDNFKNALFESLNVRFCRFNINTRLTRSDLSEVYRMVYEQLIIPNNLPS